MNRPTKRPMNHLKHYWAGHGVVLYHGDARDVIPRLDPGFMLVCTDPPYSSGGMFRGDRLGTTGSKYVLRHGKKRTPDPDFTGDNLDARSWSSFTREWLSAARRACARSAYLLVFTDWRQLPGLTDVIQHAGWVWRGVLGWNKTDAARNSHPGFFPHQLEFIPWGSNGPVRRRTRGKLRGCFTCAVNRSDRHHQAGKPTDVIAEMIRCVMPGERVLDPFAGSGTTGVACMHTGRPCVLVESEEVHCENAARRLEAEAGHTSAAAMRIFA